MARVMPFGPKPFGPAPAPQMRRCRCSICGRRRERSETMVMINSEACWSRWLEKTTSYSETKTTRAAYLLRNAIPKTDIVRLCRSHIHKRDAYIAIEKKFPQLASSARPPFCKQGRNGRMCYLCQQYFPSTEYRTVAVTENAMRRYLLLAANLPSLAQTAQLARLLCAKWVGRRRVHLCDHHLLNKDATNYVKHFGIRVAMIDGDAQIVEDPDPVIVNAPAPQNEEEEVIDELPLYKQLVKDHPPPLKRNRLAPQLEQDVWSDEEVIDELALLDHTFDNQPASPRLEVRVTGEGRVCVAPRGDEAECALCGARRVSSHLTRVTVALPALHHLLQNGAALLPEELGPMAECLMERWKGKTHVHMCTAHGERRDMYNYLDLQSADTALPTDTRVKQEPQDDESMPDFVVARLPAGFPADKRALLLDFMCSLELDDILFSRDVVFGTQLSHLRNIEKKCRCARDEASHSHSSAPASAYTPPPQLGLTKDVAVHAAPVIRATLPAAYRQAVSAVRAPRPAQSPAPRVGPVLATPPPPLFQDGPAAKKAKEEEEEVEEEQGELLTPMDEVVEERPRIGYGVLVGLALRDAPEEGMRASDVYEHIMKHFPFFRAQGSRATWRSGVRHELSFSFDFQKVKIDGAQTQYAINPDRREQVAEKIRQWCILNPDHPLSASE